MPSSAPYDELYARTEQLWPSQPGRMVIRAADSMPPGRALDLGCGDGKNAAFLLRRGWAVEGCDLSALALSQLRRRFSNAGLGSDSFIQEDVVRYKPEARNVDLVVAYGLLHCLSDESVAVVVENIEYSLRPRGVLALAALTSDLPLPPGHQTPGLRLRSRSELLQHLEGWTVIEEHEGHIEEDHWPVIGSHEHAVFWALLRKDHVGCA